MDSNRQELVFGRYTREVCGLPPVDQKSRAWIGALLLPVLLAAAGWLIGRYVARWRAWESSYLPQAVLADPEQAPSLLAMGRLRALSLPDDPAVQIHLASALLFEAERAPRRSGYYGTVAHIFRNLPDSADISSPALLLFAGMFAQMGEWEEAFACIQRAEDSLPKTEDSSGQGLRLLLMNARAYFLATAPLDRGGNPERALHLARLMVMSNEPLSGGGYASGEAAFVDTLACAWHAVGIPDQAADTQRLALGLASGSLDSYIKHYDTFRAAVDRTDAEPSMNIRREDNAKQSLSEPAGP